MNRLRPLTVAVIAAALGAAGVQAQNARNPDSPPAAAAGQLAQGSDFEQGYAENLGFEAHRDSIDLFGKEISQGHDPDVKAYASNTLPTLRQHLQLTQGSQARAGRDPNDRRAAGAASRNMSDRSANAGALKDAQEQISEAVQVVQRMKSDPEMQNLLRRARGVFILPNYGRGGLGVGVQGGEGVLVKRKGDDFSNPVFYNLGGISLGVQAGAAAGQVAMLLMTERAVQNFQSDKKFSLNVDLGLTIASYSQRAQASAGKVQDVIVWSNTKGAYAGASVAVTDVMLDREANRAYYGRDNLDPLQIIEGRVDNPRSNVLGMVLGV